MRAGDQNALEHVALLVSIVGDLRRPGPTLIQRILSLRSHRITTYSASIHHGPLLALNDEALSCATATGGTVIWR